MAKPTFVERTQVLALVHTKSALPVDVVMGEPGLEEISSAIGEDEPLVTFAKVRARARRR